MKKFTKAQQEVLQERMKIANIAQDSVNQFANYLGKEYEVGRDYKLNADLTGFEKIKKPKKT